LREDGEGRAEAGDRLGALDDGRRVEIAEEFAGHAQIVDALRPQSHHTGAGHIDRDRVLAISSAKALIEATTRLTLHELGEPVDERTDPPTLIKQALKALGLHPEVLAPDAEGAEVTKRVLPGLSQIAVSGRASNATPKTARR